MLNIIWMICYFLLIKLVPKQIEHWGHLLELQELSTVKALGWQQIKVFPPNNHLGIQALRQCAKGVMKVVPVQLLQYKPFHRWRWRERQLLLLGMMLALKTITCEFLLSPLWFAAPSPEIYSLLMFVSRSCLADSDLYQIWWNSIQKKYRITFSMEVPLVY